MFYRKFSFCTSYAKKEVYEKLKEKIYSEDRKFMDLKGSHRYFGEANENFFKANKSFLFSNTPILYIKGKVYEIESGTKVEVKISLSDTYLAFFIASIAFIVFFTTLSIIHAESLWQKVFPLIILVPLFIFIILPFLFASKYSKEDFLDLLKK